jgi:plastocyanin
VTWTNNDTAAHTATSTDGVWDSKILNTGDSFSYTFDEAGTFAYICSLHPKMTAQIVVTAP